MNTKKNSSSIAVNKRASFEYFIEETYVAGLVLEGWEVKSIRAGKISLGDAYVFLKNSEAFIIGVHITPLISTSTHHTIDATRTRKLLLNRRELSHLVGAIERKGYTCVPLKFFWNHGLVKCEIALVKGKQTHDKRESEKKRDWQREKGRIMRNGRDA
ncbi:MAG: SsrA-binding protein SmpB [Pseudomonadales bacterium]|nr:SsrA-binding protein SmpB [Pseudomonadales bacterium]